MFKKWGQDAIIQKEFLLHGYALAYSLVRRQKEPLTWAGYWKIKINIFHLQRKPKPETLHRTTWRPAQKWESYPPHSHLCKQISAPVSSECQIQLQTAASSASTWISAVQPALLLGWGWCCSFWVASSLSALLMETTLQLILRFREGFNVLLVLMSFLCGFSQLREGPTFSQYSSSHGLALCALPLCQCDWQHSSSPWDSWVR